jgi:DNA segregation ATPase FtsK/SpoIIIE, S-DNA-T family
MPSPHRSGEADTAELEARSLEFHRPARVFPVPVEYRDLTVPAPPQVPAPLDGGMAQALLPLLGSVGMVGFALMLGDRRFLIMAGIMAAAMVLSGAAARRIQVRRRRSTRDALCRRYRQRLVEIETDAETAATLQRHHEEIAHPDLADLWSLAVDRRRVWERRPNDRDFLTVRIGTGPIPAVSRPRTADGLDQMAEYEPELEQAAAELVARFAEVDKAPILVDLNPLGCIAIVGPRGVTAATARAIVCQLVLFRAPDDVRIIIGCHPDHRIDWSWTRSLQHLRQASVPAVCHDPEALATAVGSVVRPRIEHLDRLSEGASPTATPSFPRTIVVLDPYRPGGPIGEIDIIDEALRRADHIGITFLCLVEDATHVPSTTGAIITSDGGRAVLAVGATRSAPHAPASASLDRCAQLARVLAPLELRSRTGRATTFESPGLMDLLDISDPGSVIDGTTWVEEAAAASSPIGVGEDGTPVMLDLREASVGGMGPHGMLIGATGSGKSELLRTLVLGLACRHSPDDMAFVFVDFKGGATFGPLGRLPHAAGMITNLDREPSLVDRMMEALRGEMERRQRLLSESGGFDRADEYRKHRASDPGSGMEPLPALVIVVDEFSELLATRPEFADLFTSIGRLGRSLGIHMLASTQRIDDGSLRRLAGHLRFRIALRTFTAEESVAVIGSRAAAELPPIPGVGYLEVDGTLTAFKAAIASRIGPDSAGTEMDRLVDAWASSKCEPARPVWTDPLPTTVPVAALIDADNAWLSIPIGLEDRPRDQRRRPHRLHLDGRAGHVAVVGSPRSGKSTLLQTLVLSAAITHDPGDLQIYVIDMGGGGLGLFEGLPHVGAVLSRSHRTEIDKLIRRLETLIEERSARFRQHRLGDVDGYHRLRREGAFHDELGEVVLVVDNWSALCQHLSDDQMTAIAGIVANGLHHGVHLVLSANRWQDIKLGLRDNIAGRFELRLGDPIDSEIDRAAAKSLPPDVPGRGIAADGSLVQVALPRLDEGPTPVAASSAVDEVRRRWGESGVAPPIRVLPELVREDALPQSIDGGIVMGLEEHRLGPWEIDLFGPDPHLLVLGDAESGRTAFLRRLVRGLTESRGRPSARLAVVDYRRRLLHDVPEARRLAVASSPESAAVLAGRVESELAARAGADLRSHHPPLVVIVDDYELVVGASGNPLAALVDRVALGRDLGFHLVVARRLGGFSRSSFEPILQRVREMNSPCLLLSGDPQEGPLAGGAKPRPAAPGRGLWVAKGRTTEVQTVWTEPGGGASITSITEAAG